VFNHYPKGKAVYIAPLKALVRERVKDWKCGSRKGLERSEHVFKHAIASL